MAITVDKLINDERFSGDNVFQFLLYLPFGLLLMIVRSILAVVLWIASIILPNKSAVRQMLSTLACWTFGVYVKTKGKRDPRCSVMVANYVSCLDSLAASHVLGTISLRKWKVPPFFASTLGIRNAAQFVRKQHFAQSVSEPVLLQPEGGPGSGRALLRFTDWPCPVGSRAQPVAISVERVFTHVTVHRGTDSRGRFPWSDALWFLAAPITVYTLQLLPAVEKYDDDDATFVRNIRTSIAAALQVELTDFSWEDMIRGGLPPSRRPPTSTSPPADLLRRAQLVKEVLPRVPLSDIIKDLAVTRSVDVTITNLLEGVTPYTAERDPPHTTAGPPDTQPGTSNTQPRYITPTPTGVFPKSAKERQLSFQEKKAQMIAEARRRYIDKHGLNVALNNC